MADPSTATATTTTTTTRKILVIEDKPGAELLRQETLAGGKINDEILKLWDRWEVAQCRTKTCQCQNSYTIGHFLLGGSVFRLTKPKVLVQPVSVKKHAAFISFYASPPWRGPISPRLTTASPMLAKLLIHLIFFAALSSAPAPGTLLN